MKNLFGIICGLLLMSSNLNANENQIAEDEYFACVRVTFSCGHVGRVCGDTTAELIAWINTWDDEICGD
jgi:hypothetical protein